MRSANTQPAIEPPMKGMQVPMPTRISQNNATGRGVGKVNEGECTVQQRRLFVDYDLCCGDGQRMGE